MFVDSELSRLSGEMLTEFYESDLTVADVMKSLNDKIQVRTFVETLHSFYPGGELKERLIRELSLYSGLSHDNISRRVRNWLNGKNEPTRREDFIQICFALGFDEPRAQGFLFTTTDGALHLRSPKELVYAYSLRVGKPYPEAVSLANTLEPISIVSEAGASVLTKVVADAFADIDNDEDFKTFYRENRDNLGHLHETAYKYFTKYYRMLVKPEPSYDGEDAARYTNREVVEEYLRMNLPYDKQTSKYSLLQRTIRRYWPNTSSITKINNRSDDVSRRTLLLLYVITEGGVSGEQDSDDYKSYNSALEKFEDHYWRLNAILHECGMSRLDIRNPFGWLILFSLMAEEEEFMGEKLQDALDSIFANASEEE